MSDDSVVENAALDRWTNEIHEGDAFDVLAELPDESIHAVVTDPPYGLAFMGRDWDDFEPREYQEWCEKWAREAKRVLKPGGHLLAFSGNRTHHRLFSGVEDAGFEIRDTITWHYGSGFPKAMDVSRAIDKQAGDEADRETVGVKPGPEEWEGFKTALKPATEFVVVARAPLEEDTVAENVLEHGAAALNIDGCRVGTDTDTTRVSGPDNPDIYGAQGSEERGSRTDGRYPANVVFDEQAAADLDAGVGDLAAGAHPSSREGLGGENIYDSTPSGQDDLGPRTETGSGGPSRYFYTSKATRAERTLNGQIDNAHPTVKPLDLMEWLVTFVTAEGQTVLDPFCGSGTTCKVAKDLGREFVGIEQQGKWADVARVRCGLDPEDPSHVRGDDAQAGLEAFLATDGGQIDG